MKIKKFNKKLDLNKSTVADLNNSELRKVYGGAATYPGCVPTVDVTKCATNCNLETVRPSRCVC
jgi:natural product precursor